MGEENSKHKGEYKYEDAEDYNFQSKDKNSFESIVLDHVKRIVWYRSERQFENFAESVLCLSELLHARYDDEMKKAEEVLYKTEQYLIQNSNSLPHYTNEEGHEIYMNTSSDLTKQTQKSIKLNTLKIESCKKLFRILCDFLYRKGWLKFGSIED